MTTNKIAWGILGPGRIANAFAKGVQHSDTGHLQAVASRSQERADEFGGKYDIESCYDSYEKLLADEAVDAVYIATPHPQHPMWVIRAAEAGKHILCEKPVGLNAGHAMACIEAAKKNDVFFMEAFMYRCHPQTEKLAELLLSNAIGDVQYIHATFAFRGGDDPESRLISNELGGGGILDVGGYPVSMARLIAGLQLRKPFANPIEVQGAGQLHPETGVDTVAIANLKFEGDIFAQVATGVRMSTDSAVRIYGTEGNIYVLTPWLPAREGGSVSIHVTRKGKGTEEIKIETEKYLYGFEADTVARYIENRQADSPAMSWDDTMGNMQTLDRWREAIGVKYKSESPEFFQTPVHGNPMRVDENTDMKYGTIGDLAKRVSRLVMGCDNQPNFPHAAVMWDDFYERGGNTFDTGYIYGGGKQEKLLGQWLKSRAVRDQSVVISKGGHTPNCFPEKLREQLDISLDRMDIEGCDIYFMHRDNLDIPVGEFVDALNELRDENKLRVFGGSNWTIARVKEANAYAEKNGKVGFTALSNNFSLARMVDPVWAGCVAASDPESREFLKETQIALMPWSSQARGFFVRASPDFKDDAQLVRCWYSEDNFQRLERVQKMAKEKGVTPINIALAYVLHQPFPTFPLIGPRNPTETRTSWPGLTVELTPEEVAWLNLED